jgi:hypothetical protein
MLCDEIVGHRVKQLLQTPWNHGDSFSHCNFFLRLDNDLILSFDCNEANSPKGIARESEDEAALYPVESDTDFPSYFHPADGSCYPFDQPIAKIVLETFHGTEIATHVVFNDRRVLTAEVWEGQTALELRSNTEFVNDYLAHCPNGCCFTDYWSQTSLNLLELLNSVQQ